MIATTLRNITLTIAVLGMGAATQAHGESNLIGTWVTEDGLGAVEFSPCGSESCGRIVWLKNPLGEDGKPLRDVNNPLSGARQRPLCGLQVVSGLRKQEGSNWDEGTVYVPDEGKTYSVAITVMPDGNLEVTGYIGSKLFSETENWKAGSPSPRCSEL